MTHKEAEVKEITRQCMIRAAEVIGNLTDEDVERHKVAMLEAGATVDQVTKIDRALVASCYLLAMAEQLE